VSAPGRATVLQVDLPPTIAVDPGAPGTADAWSGHVLDWLDRLQQTDGAPALRLDDALLSKDGQQCRQERERLHDGVVELDGRRGASFQQVVQLQRDHPE